MIAVAFFSFLSIVDGQIPRPRNYKPTVANDRLWRLKRYEITAGIGSTQIFGDIGGFSRNNNLLGFKDFTFLQTRYNINAGVKYRIRDNVSAKLNFTFGNFHTTDTRGSNETRGLESTTMFFEPAILGEYYFIKYKGSKSFLFKRGRWHIVWPFFSMIDCYAFAGLGGLSYNVKPNDLLALRATKTSGFTAVIPGGVGMNVIYSRDFNVGLELGGRYAFSDNIDGYTSQFSKSNDIYYFLNLIFTYKIRTGKYGFPLF